MASALRVNYEKARVRPTTLDMGINSKHPTFFNQSVVGVEGINITTMACLSAENLRNLELFAQIEERAAEDDLAIIQLAQNRRKRKRRAYRRFWVRPWIQRRQNFGHYHRLMHELETEDRQSLVNFLRVPPEIFRDMEQRLCERLTKKTRGTERP